MWVWLHRFGSPPWFYRWAQRYAAWFGWPAALLITAGLFVGLTIAPPDYQQHDSYRIIYIHVPSAYLSLQVYVVMAVAAAIGLIWRIKVCHAIAASCAPIGAAFTLSALVTGALWGMPTWGTWWEWDPKLIFELVLFFFYMGYIGLRSAIDDTTRADRAAAVLAIVGVVNVPIVHFSVQWWNSIHQGSSLLRADGPSIYSASMLTGLLTSLGGYILCFVALLLTRARAEILKRERGGSWVREMLEGKS